MAKNREPRVDTAGSKPALGHNPFASLAHLASELPPGVRSEGTPHPVAKAPKAAKGKLVLRRSVKQRAGHPVLVVGGLETIEGLTAQGMRQLAQELKSELGCGGTFEEGRDEPPTIVLQCKDPARVAALLVGRGYRVEGTVR